MKLKDILVLPDEAKFKVDFQKPENWARNPKTAIRIACHFCVGFDEGYRKAIAECTSHLCPIWHFRGGRIPEEWRTTREAATPFSTANNDGKPSYGHSQDQEIEDQERDDDDERDIEEEIEPDIA